MAAMIVAAAEERSAPKAICDRWIQRLVVGACWVAGSGMPDASRGGQCGAEVDGYRCPEPHGLSSPPPSVGQQADGTGEQHDDTTGLGDACHSEAVSVVHVRRGEVSISPTGGHQGGVGVPRPAPQATMQAVLSEKTASFHCQTSPPMSYVPYGPGDAANAPTGVR